MELTKQHEKICQKLKGHYSYYGITGNFRSLKEFHHQVRRIWKRWLCRRSWKGRRLNWARYAEMLEQHYPLTEPTVIHSIYAQ